MATNEELQKKIDDLEIRLYNLEHAQNVDFVGSLEDITINSTEALEPGDSLSGSVSSDGLTRTISIPDGATNIEVPNLPNSLIEYNYKGRQFHIFANEL